MGQLTLWLGIWGAALSTTLAGLKFYEVWRDRSRIQTTYSLSDPEIGNEVTIINISGRPLLVSYWELTWVSGILWWRKEENPVPLSEPGFLAIPPHSKHVLAFAEEDWFTWGSRTVSKGRLYLRLHIAGKRRPTALMVYDPRK